MLLEGILRNYMRNLKVSLLFGLLLIFVSFFSIFQNTAFTSGTVFVEYNALQNPLSFAIELLIILAYLVFFSLFISLIVLAVRKELSKVRIEYYLTEMVQKFTLKIFWFYLIFSVASIVLASAFISAGIPPILINLILMVVWAAFMFMPQAIVIDERPLIESVEENFYFINKNPRSFALAFVAGLVFVTLLPLIEYALDLMTPGLFIGRFVSLFLFLVFVIPFHETLKTYLYMLKFDLIRRTEFIS